MDITDFKIQAHKICDRWYFKNTEDALEMWERPYLRGPGYEKDYMVVSFPFEILCNVEERSAHLTAKLQGLRYNHEKRMRGKQVEEVAGMLSRNEQRKQIRKVAAQNQTKAFFKDTRKLWGKIGEETHGVNTKAALIAQHGKGENWEDAERNYKKSMEIRQGVA
jgi:hypothetical protein